MAVLTIYDNNTYVGMYKILSYGALSIDAGISMYYFLGYDIETCLCTLAISLFLVFYILIILDSVSNLLIQVEENYLKYKNLVDFIHGFFIIVDENFKIKFINKEILNYGMADLIGKNLKEFPFYNEKKMKSLISSNKKQRYKWKYEDKKGEVFWYMIDTTIQTSSNGTEIALLIHDISSEKRVEEQEKVKIEYVSSLKAKNEFIASISHEIRNPLQVISYNAENLLSKSLSQDCMDIIKDINNSTKFLTTIIGDILDYSKIEAGEMKIQKSDFDLLEIAETSISMNTQSCLEKGLDITLNYDFNLPKVFYGDSSRILQIMNNIVTNAVKYTNVGYLEINMNKNISEDGNEVLYFECRDTGIGISQKHLKNLFDPFVQIFEKKFSPTKFKGWGLGLPICQKLLTLMNGELGVESVSGTGSTFWFKIPIKKTSKNLSIGDYYRNMKPIANEINIICSDKKVVSEIERTLKVIKIPKIHNSKPITKQQHIIIENNALDTVPNEIEKSRIILLDLSGKTHSSDYQQLKYPILPSALLSLFTKKTRKKEQLESVQLREDLSILIVDDNKLILKSLERLLRSLNIGNIQKAMNGKEALELVDKNDNLFDLIFMDISMPVLNGIEATDLIRKLKNEKKSKSMIVALTGNTLMKSREEHLAEWKMNEILSKPVNKKDLLGIINMIGK